MNLLSQTFEPELAFRLDIQSHEKSHISKVKNPDFAIIPGIKISQITKISSPWDLNPEAKENQILGIKILHKILNRLEKIAFDK